MFCIFSFLLLVGTGSLGLSSQIEVLRVGPVSFTQGAALFAICVLDLLFLAALVAWRREKPSSFPTVPQ